MTFPQLKALKPSIEDKLEALNQSYAVVRWNSQTVIMQEVQKPNEKPNLFFMGKNDFILWNENNIFWDQIENRGKIKTVKIKMAQAWLEWHKRRQYEELIFDPARKEEEGIYNLWRGFSFKPKKDAGKFDIFLDHIRVNICNENEEHYKWVVGWMADLIQQPQRKLGTALVLRGERGVGKGMLFKHLGALIKMHYLAVQRTEHVTGKFNGHFADTILLFLDEAFWGGNKEAEGVLKSLITEEDAAIEKKGRDLYRMKSFLRIGMSTNNDWAVPAGLSDERRFGIFDVGTRCQKNRTYFGEMEKELHEGGYEALLFFLLEYKYDVNSIASIPQTEALLDQKIHSMSHELRWWQTCLSNGHIGSFDNGAWENEIKRGNFYESYIRYCKNMNVRHPTTLFSLTKYLKKYKVEFKEKKDKQVAGEGWFYQLMSLDECRASFEKVLGQKITWEE